MIRLPVYLYVIHVNDQTKQEDVDTDRVAILYLSVSISNQCLRQNVVGEAGGR